MKGRIVERTEAQEICICPSCPTYLECDEPPAFCLLKAGKSACIKAEHGCICGGCPVHDALEFQFGYYCTRGSEAAQAG
jgi:hypothetical protein